MDLSVILVSYNTKDLTIQAMDSVKKALSQSPNLKYEIILVDNHSTDGSHEAFLKYPDITYLPLDSNLGFGAGNNVGIKKANGLYTLLLNTDVLSDNVNFENLLSYMNKHNDIGALTVRIELQNGKIDPASHRGFPTLWRSFCYFSKLEKITSTIPILNKVFGGYHMTQSNLHSIHEIDSPTGAFYVTRTHLLQSLHGFDEDFFMYGEDLDLSFRIKQKGYKIIWYPKYTAIHLKHQSGLKNNNEKRKSETHAHFYNAMKIFYDKHYAQKYPKFINSMVYKAINYKSR